MVSGFHQLFTVVQCSDLLGLSLHANWGSLYDLCRNSSRQTSTFELTFIFSIIAFGAHAEIKLLRTLLSFAFSSAFKKHHPPDEYTSYDLSNGSQPIIEQLREAIRSNILVHLRQELTPDEIAEKTGRQVEVLANHFISQWPCSSVTLRASPVDFTYIATAGAISKLNCLYAEWWKNRQLEFHLDTISEILSSINSTTNRDSIVPLYSSNVVLLPSYDWIPPSLSSLMKLRAIDIDDTSPSTLTLSRQVLTSNELEVGKPTHLL